MNEFKVIKNNEKYLANHLHGTSPKLLYVPFSIVRVLKTSTLNLLDVTRRFCGSIALTIKQSEQKFDVNSVFINYGRASVKEVQDKWNLQTDHSAPVMEGEWNEHSNPEKNNRIAIVILGFNRPEKLVSLLESLIADTGRHKFDFIAYVDGPRTENERIKTEQSISIVKELLPPSSEVIVSQNNRGLRSSVILAGTQVFEKYSKAIFLEDDLLIQPGFIDFMVKNLDKHEKNLRILSVSGHQPIDLPPAVSKNLNDSELFLRRPHSWGWATWDNRWFNIDWSTDYLKQAALSKSIRKNLSTLGLDTVPMLRSQLQGDINSWAISFCLHSSITDQRNVYPVLSLTKNDGHGEDSTHTGNFFREQPFFLKYFFILFRKFSSPNMLNSLFDLIFFRYYSQRPTKVEVKA